MAAAAEPLGAAEAALKLVSSFWDEAGDEEGLTMLAGSATRATLTAKGTQSTHPSPIKPAEPQRK